LTGGIEFDWDEKKTRHLAKHKVTRAEFEQAMNVDPMDLEYQVADEGRILTALWISVSARYGKARAVTAFDAPVADRKYFWRDPE
jgi:hypothetical protein